MDTHCHHGFQHLPGRLNVIHAVLDGPRSIPWDVNALPHRDGQILVPGYFPILAGHLVKEDGANGTRRWPQHTLHCPSYLPTLRDQLPGGVIQHIAAIHSPRSIVRILFQKVEYPGNLVLAQELGHY